MTPPNQSAPVADAPIQENGSPTAMFFTSKSDPGTHQLTALASVTEVGVYRGPHYYSHTPMIRIQVDLGRLEEWPTNRIAGFTEALLDLLPGVGRHGCSLRVRGGFERRLREGTWLGHVWDPLESTCRHASLSIL